MSESEYELNEVIHANLFNPYLSKEIFKINCELISKYNIRNISTSLYFLKYLKDSINYKNCKINALISYPLADIPSKFLSEIINYAKEYGANGIEFLPRFFPIKYEPISLETIKKHVIKVIFKPVKLL